MATKTFKDADGTTTIFTRDESLGIVEEVKFDPAGDFLTKTVYAYDSSGRIVQYSIYDQRGQVVKRVTMSYGANPWEAQRLEFGADGELQRRTDFIFDSENHCKAHIFYSATGEYIGRALDKVDEDGVFRGLKYFDKHGNRIMLEPT